MSYVKEVELRRFGNDPQTVEAVVQHAAERGEGHDQGTTRTQEGDVVPCVAGQQHDGAHVGREVHYAARAGAWRHVMTWNDSRSSGLQSIRLRISTGEVRKYLIKAWIGDNSMSYK